MHKFFTKTLSVAIGVCLLIAGAGLAGAVVKDQSRLGASIDGKTAPKKPDSLLPNLPDVNPGGDDNFGGGQTPPITPPGNAPAPQGDEYANPVEPYDINNIPALIKLDLTIDIAKRAIDAFADIGSRYDDKGLYQHPTLEQFVAKTDAGKQLEADVKKYGFKDVVEWNTAIMNVSFAFGSLLQDQEADIRAQIKTVGADSSLSAEKKRRVIASLTALIPTKENIAIIKELRKLPNYRQKLNLLDAFE